MTPLSFAEMSLDSRILDALKSEDYTTPTPIQAQAIPTLNEGRDVLGIAQTGTGKTAAFVLPILNRMAAKPAKAKPRQPEALILAPTRELAIQIGESIETYGQNLHLRTAVIFGGVGQNPQIQKLVRGVHILVATPGRLLDLIGQGHVNMAALSVFVLDEADRMLDMGFIRDVRKIAETMPQDRQTMLLSATMPRDIEKLAESLLKDPTRIEVTPKVVTVDRIEQSVYFCEAEAKRAMLADILKDESIYRVIVFTRTKHRANRVAEFLNARGYSAEAIHGNKSQSARQRSLKSFTDGDTRVLVATDIAARGIDIDDVTHVVNFELPNEPESYVHRIGRTARAGADGVAISLCSPDERPYLRDIEALIGREITDANERPFMERIPKKPKPAQTQSRGNGRSQKPGRRASQKQGQKAEGQKAGEQRSSKRKSAAAKPQAGRGPGGVDRSGKPGRPGQQRAGGRPKSRGARGGRGKGSAAA